jgi:ATP-binding cassette subfamily C protein CydCD
MTRRLFSLARDNRFHLAATILCGFLAGLLTIWQASILSQVIDRVFLGGQPEQMIAGLLRFLLLVVFLRAVLAWVSEVSANAMAVQIKAELRRRLFEKLLRLGPAYARRQRTGELVNASIEGVESLEAYFSQYLPQLVIAALVPFSILVVVFPRDPLSGLILLLTAPLIPVFMVLIGKAAETLTKHQWESLSRLSAHFLDSLQGLAALKELGRSREHAGSIAEASDRFREITMSVLRVTFLSALVLELVATISTALVAVEVGLRLLYGQMTFQPALFLLLLAPEFYIPLRMLGMRFHAGMAGTSAARRIFEVLDIREQRTGNREQGTDQDEIRKPASPLFSNDSLSVLSISDLSFTYPGETSPTLQTLSLEVRAGEHIALVGSSGVGKSTLAALLLRFSELDGGQMAMNNVPSTEIPLDAWRKCFAWVPQDPFLFHDTIAANLRLASPDATDVELHAAAGLASLDEFIQSLPDGYATVISEQGARLSAGQAQRLALARAFLSGAPIIILDEPTSNLDPEQEALLETCQRTLMRDRTVITIAHRLNTVFQADKIFVLEGGRIVESGKNRELLEKSGTYAAMVRASSVESQTSKASPDLRPSTFDFQPTTFDLRSSDFDFQASTFDLHPSTGIYRPLSIVHRLLSFLRGSWGWVMLSVLLGVLTVGSNVGLMGTSAFLISAAALHPEFGALQLAIVGVRFFGIARGVFRYTERLASHNVTFRLLARLRVWFYQALEPLAPARLMQYRSGDLLGRIVSDVAVLENFYVRVVSPPLVAVLTLVGMMVFFNHFASALAWTYLVFMLLLGLGVPLLALIFNRRLGAEFISRRAGLQARMVDGIQGLADLLAFGRGSDYLLRLVDEERLYGRVQRRLAAMGGLSSALTVLLVNLGTLAILILAIQLVGAGSIPAVMLAVLTLAASAGFEAVMPLPLAAQTFSSSRQAARRLFEIVDVKPAVVDSPEITADLSLRPVPLPGPSISELLSPDPWLHDYLPAPILLGITFNNLSFTYPGQSYPAIRDINLQLGRGKRLAIVGPSGAGKSTLVNLLLRFWDYSDGQILLDGRDLHAFPQEQVRRFFSTISQNTYFFNDTIRRNLLLARPNANMLEIEEAARRAQIHAFITALERGYDTVIGERGFRLSGGERQRLAIARALLKNAPIFLLDEPTANLDPLTEQRVLEGLFSLARGYSLLFITHRLVGLEKMDEIIVLEHGSIIERGKHVELLARGGFYLRMWDFQNRILKELL